MMECHENVEELMEYSLPEASARSIKWGMNKFSHWLTQCGRKCDMATVQAGELNTILCDFYGSIKSDLGEMLSSSGLRCLRSAINRYINIKYQRTFNLMSDLEFNEANKIHAHVCEKSDKNGKKEPRNPFPIISGEDMEKLRMYFSRCYNDPHVLYQVFWFLTCYYFGPFNRAKMMDMTKDSLVLKNDVKLGEYIELSGEEIATRKVNHQRFLQRRKICGAQLDICKFYLSKLSPQYNRLFQYPRKMCKKYDQVWFSNPIGKNTLQRMLSIISKNAGLSHIHIGQLTMMEIEKQPWHVLGDNSFQRIDELFDPIQPTSQTEISQFSNDVHESTEEVENRQEDITEDVNTQGNTSDSEGIHAVGARPTEQEGQLFRHLDGLWRQDLLTDVTLSCEGQTFRAHRVVLSAHSQTLHTLLVNNNTTETPYIHRGGEINMDNFGISAECLKQALEFCYTGTLPISQIDTVLLLGTAKTLCIWLLVEFLKNLHKELGQCGPPFLKAEPEDPLSSQDISLNLQCDTHSATEENDQDFMSRLCMIKQETCHPSNHEGSQGHSEGTHGHSPDQGSEPGRLSAAGGQYTEPRAPAAPACVYVMDSPGVRPKPNTMTGRIYANKQGTKAHGVHVRSVNSSSPRPSGSTSAGCPQDSTGTNTRHGTDKLKSALTGSPHLISGKRKVTVSPSDLYNDEAAANKNPKLSHR